MRRRGTLLFGSGILSHLPTVEERVEYNNHSLYLSKRRGTQDSVDHGAEFRITSGLRKYACFFTLDPNTANYYLILSEENRKATYVEKKQPYPDNPDRFDYVNQVLCRESVSGRCYWEVQWSGVVSIAVSYKSISRKGEGKECYFEESDKSWSLFCYPERYSFWHNGKLTHITLTPLSSRRIGVYVDPIAGTLSFYRVYANTETLLLTVQTTFFQPLYPGFDVWKCFSVKLC